MRRRPTKRIEQYRIRRGQLASKPEQGANGAFMIPHEGITLAVIVSDGDYWDFLGNRGSTSAFQLALDVRHGKRWTS